jgi:serine/threonine protein kinase
MIGTKLAHYEITSHLGTGGMGEVYEALDTKLGRSVAVKFLPEIFAGDADREPRFAREARVLASLNHPSPQWRKDGKELFYLSPDSRVVTQAVNLSDSRVEPGSAMPLFTLSPGGTFAATPDGQRFFVNEITKPAAPITILLNWKPR